MTDNHKKLYELYEAAAANPGQKQLLGDIVICDLCNGDWTNNTKSGGFIFESKGVCPHCADVFLQRIKESHEEHFIQATCGTTESFADFVRKYRGPNSGITITRGAPRCRGCGEMFSKKNVHTHAGWKETSISGLCEDCFDGLFEDDED